MLPDINNDRKVSMWGALRSMRGIRKSAGG